MEVTEYLIDNISHHISGFGTGRELVKLFNQFGIKDIYSSDRGLPDIGKENGQKTSKTEYVKDRLKQLSIRNDGSLRRCLNIVVNKIPQIIESIKELLNDEGYVIEKLDDNYVVQGGVVINAIPVVNEAYFQDIQNKILGALDGAKVSIKLIVAWFTNETLFDKLLEKCSHGVEVEIAIYDDGINKKYGVDINKLPHKKIKYGQKGGVMHNKFCVIDNQVVVTGSYNWTNKAEFKNDENITIEHDPVQATRYSVEYRRLTNGK